MHIVLDLDQTLIHTDNGRTCGRPGLQEFLAFLFKTFDSVSIWTAGTQKYASSVISRLFPEYADSFMFIWSREHTDAREGTHFKPLEKMYASPTAQYCGMNETNTLMIDDRDDILRDNPGNGLIIPAWYSGMTDDWLYRLQKVLRELKRLGVRPQDMKNSIYL
jgi:TFIIF-interacting CTD phosphatase-like protein